jgi:hypothetical protein
VAALVALASSFALGGIAFGLLVAGLLLPWPGAQVRRSALAGRPFHRLSPATD